MASTCLAFPLTCGEGHVACCSVALTDSGGWDIRVEIDTRVVLSRHCTEWHRVERLCADLRGQCWEGCAQPSSHQALPGADARHTDQFART